MTHLREIAATAWALLVIFLTGGDLPLGLVTWGAVWFILTPRERYVPTAMRRWLMRETEKRNNAISNDWRKPW